MDAGSIEDIKIINFKKSKLKMIYNKIFFEKYLTLCYKRC